jgi:hypothetical protein
MITVESGDMTGSVAVIALTAVVWLIWDIYAYLTDRKTLSYYITRWSFYTPMVPFIIGFLMGHWLWTSIVYICKH